MFHTLVYTALAAQSAAYQNLAGVADSEFSRRGTNNNFIFSEQYNLLGAYLLETAPAAARVDMPTINAIGRHHIHPLNAGVVVPSRPYWQDLRDFPMPLPMNEEFAVQIINATAGTEQSTLFAWIAPPGWSRNIPRSGPRLTIHATCTVTGVANAFTSLGSLVFDENLRNGYYAIVGCQAMFANLQLARFVFAKPTFYKGRRLRPGILGHNAITEFPADWQMGGMGVFGTFHTFEPPQMEFIFVTTGSKAVEVFLDVIYLGENAVGSGMSPYPQ